MLVMPEKVLKRKIACGDIIRYTIYPFYSAFITFVIRCAKNLGTLYSLLRRNKLSMPITVTAALCALKYLAILCPTKPAAPE